METRKKELHQLKNQPESSSEIQQKIREKEQEVKESRERLEAARKEARDKLEKPIRNVLPHLNVATERNGAVFYDNGEQHVLSEHKKNEQLAKEFCAKPGNEHCRTLGMTPGGKWADGLNLHNLLDTDTGDAIGKSLSRRFAQEAKGDVNAFVRVDSAPERTWASVENPTLRANQEVTSISNHYRISPDQEIVRRESLARSRQDKLPNDRIKQSQEVNRLAAYEKARQSRMEKQPTMQRGKPKNKGKDYE